MVRQGECLTITDMVNHGWTRSIAVATHAMESLEEGCGGDKMDAEVGDEIEITEHLAQCWYAYTVIRYVDGEHTVKDSEGAEETLDLDEAVWRMFRKKRAEPVVPDRPAKSTPPVTRMATRSRLGCA